MAEWILLLSQKVAQNVNVLLAHMREDAYATRQIDCVVNDALDH